MAPEGGMRLRPMTIGDVVDETIKIYRRHFLTFVSAMAGAAVLQALLAISLNLAAAGMGQPRGPSVEQIVAVAAVGLPLGLITSLFYVVSVAAVIWIASEAILGRETDVRSALGVGLGRLPALLWVSILYGLAVGLLSLTIIGIPFAVYLAIGWALVYQAVVVERLGGRAALGRSSGLVGGYRWRVLGTSILVSILTSILVNVPTALVSTIAGVGAVLSSSPGRAAITIAEIVNAVVAAGAQAIFAPLALITMTVLYYELRVRKEAFDLEQRAVAFEDSGADRPPYSA